MTLQEAAVQAAANAAAQSIQNQSGQTTSGFMQHVEMHNFCPKCGLKREAAWKFCPTDGKTLTDHPVYAPNWQSNPLAQGYAGTLGGYAVGLKQNG